MEMLCIMHDATPCGSLIINGKPLNIRQIASLAGGIVNEIEELMMELEEAGVFGRDDDGTIYSRRIRRDVEKAARDRENGKTGGNPAIKKGVNPSVNVDVKAQKPEARSYIPKERITEANASDAVPSSPKYIDAKHELWGEGKRLLGELDIPQSRCGALIGGWCKETGDNYAGVLDAIARAREAKPLNPIPWIVQALPHKAKKNVDPQPSRLRQFIKDFIGDEENEQDGGGCETVVNGNVLMLSNGNK